MATSKTPQESTPSGTDNQTSETNWMMIGGVSVLLAVAGVAIYATMKSNK